MNLPFSLGTFLFNSSIFSFYLCICLFLLFCCHRRNRIWWGYRDEIKKGKGDTRHYMGEWQRRVPTLRSLPSPFSPLYFPGAGTGNSKGKECMRWRGESLWGGTNEVSGGDFPSFPFFLFSCINVDGIASCREGMAISSPYHRWRGNEWVARMNEWMDKAFLFLTLPCLFFSLPTRFSRLHPTSLPHSTASRISLTECGRARKEKDKSPTPLPLGLFCLFLFSFLNFWSFPFSKSDS